MSTSTWTESLFAALHAHFLPLPELEELLHRSESSDGFERERVVVQLGLLGSPIALPALILRANEWVPQVRAAAIASLWQLAVPANAAAFVACLPVFHWLRNCRRAEHAPLVEQIEAFVCRPENAHHVVEGMHSTVHGVAHACLLLAIRHRLPDAATLVRMGLNHADVSVRARVAPLIAELDGAAQSEAIAAALGNRRMPLRRAALQALLRETPDVAYYSSYLFDRHVSVRQLVATRLAEHGVDVAAAYRGALTPESTPKQRRTGLWGLGEFGRKDDDDRIARYLGDPTPAVRRQALVSLARRSGHRVAAAVLRALGDDADSVANEAARIAARLNLRFEVTELLPILMAAPRDGAVRRLANAHRASNKWERLIFLLLARRHNVDGLREFRGAYERWHEGFNHSFVQPTAAQTSYLRDAVRAQPERPDHHYDGKAMQHLRSILSLQGIANEDPL